MFKFLKRLFSPKPRIMYINSTPHCGFLIYWYSVDGVKYGVLETDYGYYLMNEYGTEADDPYILNLLALKLAEGRE